MANPDGSGRDILVETPSGNPYGICLDFAERYLYWTDEADDAIEKIHLESKNRSSVQFTHSTVPDLFPYGVATYYEDIYFTDIRIAGVFAVDSDINIQRVGNRFSNHAEIHIYADASCDGGNLCESGRCVFIQKRHQYYVCICPPGVTGSYCELDVIDDCESSPCVNGICSDSGAQSYICTCETGFTGTNCDLDANDCYPSPCVHGTCRDTGTLSYVCTCDQGYTGASCNMDVNDCESSPCVNGICSDTGAQSYICTCETGYTGTNCNMDVNDCESSPCVNGICRDTGAQSYICTCETGYTGTNCNMDINDCYPSPCVHGTCLDTGTQSYTCTCDAGYTAMNCDMDVNDCEPSPCVNGFCTDTGALSYNCTCDIGYTGTHCDVDINECLQPNLCGMNEECTNTEGEYDCTCSVNFERKGGICMVAESVGGSVRFSRLDGQAVTFSDELNDPMSEEYRNMATQCRSIINNVVGGLMETSTSTSSWELSINGFTEGSIIVDFEIKIFEISRDLLQAQAAMVETSLGDQNTGLWTSADNSVSMTVDSVIAYGGLCLVDRCGVYGSCRTRPGVSDYWCECLPGYSGQHCETVITCDLPNLPFSQVLNPHGVYMGGDHVTIECDNKDASFVWTCDGTSGEWEELASVDCQDDPTTGIPTAAIIGIAVGILIVIIIGMVLFFLYKFARPRVDRTNSRLHNYEPSGQNSCGVGAVSGQPGPDKDIDGIYNPGGDFCHANGGLYETLPGEGIGLATLPVPTLPPRSRGDANPATPTRGATAAPGFSGSQPPLYSIQDPNGNVYDTAIPRTTTRDASPSPLPTRRQGTLRGTPETRPENTNTPAIDDADADYIALSGGVSSVYIA